MNSEEQEKNNKSNESIKTLISESNEMIEVVSNDGKKLLTSVEDFSNGGGVLDIAKDLDKGEHMLPVHFLPEGRKAYDWINKDLKNDALMEKKKSRHRTL